MNNAELSTDFDSSNEEYNINNNINRNKVVNNSRISDRKNNDIVPNNVVNRSFG